MKFKKKCQVNAFSKLRIIFFLILFFFLGVGSIFFFFKNRTQKKAAIDLRQPELAKKENSNQLSFNNTDDAINYLIQKYDYIELDARELIITRLNDYQGKFENEKFIVSYPLDKNKKAYGDTSFHLCPVDQCQDDEMSIYFEDIKLEDWLLNQKWLHLHAVTRHPEDYKIKIYRNVKLNHYHRGIAYKIIRLIDRDIDNDGKIEFFKTPKNDLILVVALETDKGLIHGRIDLNNQIHQAIWSSLVLK